MHHFHGIHIKDETIAEQTKNAEMKNTENVLTQEQEKAELSKMVTLLKTAGEAPAKMTSWIRKKYMKILIIKI